MTNKKHSRFHSSLIHSYAMSDRALWMRLYENIFSPKEVLKYIITDRVRCQDTSLPENCVINPEKICDFLRVSICNAPEAIQQFTMEVFKERLERYLAKCCRKGKLRSIVINGTLYYEP